jgi:hypothetical protein
LDASGVLTSAGWARSIGGVNPYLTLFSRAAVSREQADRAAEDLRIYELPAARGCTYVLPHTEFAIGLKVGETFGSAEMQVARKLGVTDLEIDRLCKAVLAALASGPTDPAALRTAVGDTARSLGEEGKKKGLTTTLPVALGRLQATGKILRKPVNGRFDVQRYAYTLWPDGPCGNTGLTTDEAFDALARRYFKWIGPATPANFAWFTGLPKGSVKTILDGLPLTPIEPGAELLILSEDLDEFKGFKPPMDPVYRLVGGLDALFLLRREVRPHLADEDLVRQVPTSKGTATSGSVQDLSNNAIVDRGRIVGLWEYDFDRSEIAWHSFVPRDQALKDEVSRTEAFVRDQLGDARTLSLDSPQSRRPMIDALRAAAAAESHPTG